MRTRYLLLLALALVAPVGAELNFVEISATDSNSAETLAAHTKTVTLVASGANRVHFTLFNDADTPSAATTSDGWLDPGETVSIPFIPNGTQQGASYWAAIAAICDTGETATLRVWSE